MRRDAPLLPIALFRMDSLFGAHIAWEMERWRPVLKAGEVKAD